MSNIRNDIPLLVPSFSSKGNLFLPKGNKRYVSDNYDLVDVLGIRLAESYLLSAYDIYYGFVPENPSDWPETKYLFVDSGGYETNDSFDLSERNKFNYRVMPWNEGMMQKVYERVCSTYKFENTTIILSGFDQQKPVNDQLESFALLQQQFPTTVIDQLVKITDSMDAIVNTLVRHKNLQSVQILGFTEKELGRTLSERLHNVIFVKKQLLEAGWNGYIHIFGGLEPSLMKLYYAAGADIFDGLSWQRIRYRGNSTLYNPSHYYAFATEEENKLWMMMDNLAELQSVKNDLSLFCGQRAQLCYRLKCMLTDQNLSIYELLLGSGLEV